MRPSDNVLGFLTSLTGYMQPKRPERYQRASLWQDGESVQLDSDSSLSTPGAGVYSPSLLSTDRNIAMVSLNCLKCKNGTNRPNSRPSIPPSRVIKANRRNRGQGSGTYGLPCCPFKPISHVLQTDPSPTLASTCCQRKCNGYQQVPTLHG